MHNSCRDSIDLALIESIKLVSQIMDKQTIAEFTEDDATIAPVTKIGVDCAQRYGLRVPKSMR